MRGVIRLRESGEGSDGKRRKDELIGFCCEVERGKERKTVEGRPEIKILGLFFSFFFCKAKGNKFASFLFVSKQLSVVLSGGRSVGRTLTHYDRRAPRKTE